MRRARSARRVDGGQHVGPAGVGERTHLARHPLGRAAGEQHVGGALGDDGDATLALQVGLQGAHELALRGERDLTHPFEPRPSSLREPDLGLGHQEGGFGRVAPDGPLPAVVAQHGDVAGDDVDGGKAFLPPVAPHAGRGPGHALEGGDRLLGPGLLDVAQHAVGHDDHGDDDDLDRHPVAAFERPRRQRDDDGAHQQVDQRVGELGEELPPRRHPLGGVEPVGPVASEARRRLGAGQPPVDVRTQLGGDPGRLLLPRIGGDAPDGGLPPGRWMARCR